ncbi:MAG: PEP-CTERM sorting domain-containing protein [Desulfobulbaceae bacterium]|nr:PEP-CTERM sorting domain-containing protein [Desulfobulbaceae bacterium]
MKEYSRLVVALVAGCCLLQSAQALAGSQTFDDTTLVFPNYTGNNLTDTIVGPRLNSMTVNWDNDGNLTSIVLNSSSSYYQWDSLFINTDYNPNYAATGSGDGAWDGWDYLVHTGNGAYGTQESVSLIPSPGLYSVSDNYDYTHSTGRAGHVNGIDVNDLSLVNAGIVGVVTTPASGVYVLTYDFTSLSTKIALGDNFIIGYTPYCANDVMLAYADGSSVGTKGGAPAVPEPATMILFGAGIAALAGYRARHTKK